MIPWDAITSVERFERAVRGVSAWPSSTGTPSSNRGGRLTSSGSLDSGWPTASRRTDALAASDERIERAVRRVLDNPGEGERKRLTRDRGVELSVTDRER
ncbi:hypothetical protein BRC90_00485 [Halobacteriales archaeon QS_4_69_34]|nr:MAG: hypothetical protein BRC90_00485 [Halobacteriales archaeon QS_4_69_34]